MRKFPSIVAALGLVAVSLTGCSLLTVDAADCERPVSPAAATDYVSASGELGTIPEIEVAAPVRTRETIFTDVVVGDGQALATENQFALLAISFFSATTGELIATNASNLNAVPPEQISRWTSQFPGFATLLDCATAGSRVLGALDSNSIGETNRQGLDIGAGDAVIAVIDVLDGYLSRAEGSRQFSAGQGLPSIVRASDGRPGVSIPGRPAPTELRTELLIKGEGAPVEHNVPVLLQITALNWDDSSIVMNTWDEGATWFGLDGTVSGLDLALDGVAVGSQVLVVVPPELAFGDEGGRLGNGTVAPGTTLVFVIDVLGIYSPPAA